MCRVQKAKKSNFLPEKQQNDRQREGKDLVVIFYQKSMQKKAVELHRVCFV